MANEPPEDLHAQIAAATALLEGMVANRGWLAYVDEEERMRLLMAAGRVSKPDKAARKRLDRERRAIHQAKNKEKDQALLDTTGIRKGRMNPIFLTPRRQEAHGERAPSKPAGTLNEERVCYVCRSPYTAMHHFYDQLCCDCGDFNYAKRDPSADLSGRVALVTGARLKIGYQAAIQLLRNGCHVVACTRFPKDAARRYSEEPDFADWRDRIEIEGIDLRHIPSVEAMCARLCERLPRLDFIINNACQTVRRPPGYYNHLLEGELAAPKALAPAAAALLAPTGGELAPTELTEVPSAAWSQAVLAPGDEERSEALFPTGQLDADEQQVDLRRVNSWRLHLHEVPTVEMLEVQLVNAVAPFLLNARLKPLMEAVPTADKHIVNVSAMEGQFYRTFKTARHPHTNMAKAALNMMTRTSAADYVEAGIHMNSVDTGWVTDEDPAQHAARKQVEHNFHPPLDIVDGAARIVDPIFHGIATGEHIWGQFLKDYKITDW